MDKLKKELIKIRKEFIKDMRDSHADTITKEYNEKTLKQFLDDGDYLDIDVYTSLSWELGYLAGLEEAMNRIDELSKS